MPVNVDRAYRRYGPMVLRRCRRMLGDEAAALDAMQDTFVRLLRSRERLDEQALSSLLYRMATNVCLNRIRSTGRKPEVPDSDLLERIAEATSGTRRVGALSVLNRLFEGEKESTAEIAVLHLLDGLTLEETAEAVGLSVSGVRKRLRGVKAKLEKMG